MNDPRTSVIRLLVGTSDRFHKLARPLGIRRWSAPVTWSIVLAAFLSGAGLLLRAQAPQAVGTWASLGATPESRVGAAAVGLPDGRTLIAGGSVNGTPTASVVILNPADGSSTAAALWNPIDLGYSAVQISYQLVKGTAKAEPGAKISIGRVGEITLDDGLSADMAPPFEFNKDNIEEFSKIY